MSGPIGKSDPYDMAVVAAYRNVFFNSEDGLTVLDDILNSLGHYATEPFMGMNAEVQLALEHQAKGILDKLGVFRFNNLDGYLKVLKQAPPRYYEAPVEEEGDD